jgi:hypothetical protein
VTAITILDIPTLPINYFMRSAGEAKVMISWDRPSDTGSGSSSYPLLRYDFEYFKDGAEATTLTKVSLFDSNVTYTTPPLNLGDLYKGRIRAVNDVAMSVWTGYLQAYALLTPDPPESVVAVNLGVFLSYYACTLHSCSRPQKNVFLTMKIRLCAVTCPCFTSQFRPPGCVLTLAQQKKIRCSDHQGRLDTSGTDRAGYWKGLDNVEL